VIENAGLSVKIVALPPGEDPDSFVRSHGSSALAGLLETAPPAIVVRIDQQIERLRAGFDSPAKVAPKAETLIRRLTPREEWDRWRVYVAARLQVSVDDLRNSRFLSDSANFAPRIRTAPSESRHVAASVEPLSFEREVITILLEEPQLAAEFGDRIEASRFRNEIYRRLYEKIIGSARHLTTTADVLGLFAEDQGVLELLSELSRRDRSSTVRYGDTDQRRAHLERVVDRLRLQDERQRYRELSDLIDHQLADGRAVPQELRGEFEALVAKLKR